MTKYITVGLITAVILAAVGGYVHSQDTRLKAQAVTLAEQGQTIGVLYAANAAQAKTIDDLQADKKRDETLVADTAGKIEKLTTRIQSLDRITREALNGQNLTLDSLLPPDAALALCLQWHEASGRSAGDYPANAATGADARAGDTAAAGGGSAPDCANWRRLTVRGAVEWNGALLRHAGLERTDKAAMRAWTGEVTR